MNARALWLGWALWSAVYLAVVAWGWPALLKTAGVGVCLGAAYQASLFWNARHPRAVGAQLAFSAARALAFALMIALVAGASGAKLAIVILGFLSYKGGVVALGAAQLATAARRRKSAAGGERSGRESDVHRENG